MLAVKDLAKMTNAQLQAELKKRGLAESGKKAELVERLSEAVRKEEEDAILNATADSGDMGVEADLSAAEALLEPESDEAPVEEEAPEAVEAAKEEEKEAPAPVTGEKPKRKSIDDESNDAKLKRAQRFGLPIGVAPAAAATNDAKQKRAERFGITAPVTSDDMKAKRAERFGITATPTATADNGKASDDKKASRAARFGLSTVETPEVKEKLLARAQRFGIPVNAEGKNVKRAVEVDPEMEAKKKARAERFAQQSQ